MSKEELTIRQFILALRDYNSRLDHVARPRLLEGLPFKSRSDINDRCYEFASSITDEQLDRMDSKLETVEVLTDQEKDLNNDHFYPATATDSTVVPVTKPAETEKEEELRIPTKPSVFSRMSNKFKFFTVGAVCFNSGVLLTILIVIR